MTDNTTTVAILNHMGTSHSMSCNDLCKSIWEWCLKGSIWLSVVHIPGKANIRADIESRRKYSSSSEWMINTQTLLSFFEQLSVQPNIDLFASRLNYQLDCFVSFKPDPYSYAIDAFTLDWGKYDFYIFPPFSLVSRVLSKIQMDHAEGVCVLPDWPTQPWYPKAKSLLKLPPIILKPSKYLLVLSSHPETIHPLHSKLQLLVCLLSAKN